jgi:hypothetical protein
LAGGVTAPVLSLSSSIDTGVQGDGVTSNPFPAIAVQGAPANVALQLWRDNQPVNTVVTGPTPPAVLTIPDNRLGAVPIAAHTYTLVQLNADRTPVRLGQVEVNVIAPEAAARPAPVSTTAVISSDMMHRFVSQLGTLANGMGAANPATVPAQSVAPVVTAPPSSGNQINLNQFFGKTNLAGPTAAPVHRRFPLFHHKGKARPVVRTVNLAGLDADAAAVAGASAAQSTAAQPPRFAVEPSPNAPVAPPVATGNTGAAAAGGR